MGVARGRSPSQRECAKGGSVYRVGGLWQAVPGRLHASEQAGEAIYRNTTLTGQNTDDKVDGPAIAEDRPARPGDQRWRAAVPVATPDGQQASKLELGLTARGGIHDA